MVAALLTSLPPSAYAEWSKQDQQRQLAYTALHMVDWGQTLDIADQPKDYYETNPVLGQHPSRSEVNTYMATSLATHWLIARRLTPKKRRIFQWTTIVIEGLYITNNKRIGLSVNF